jgi:ABC-type polysaccharide/polyol phosphate transport system ATPase subunit
MPIIEFRNVYKYFPRLRGQLLISKRLAGLVRRRHKEQFCALKDISFEVHSGESLAIIGPNGAGKSTLLGLVAGLARPNAGSVLVEGRVAALLELGSGFHFDLTGAENVRLNAALLGLTRRETELRYGEIVEFSGISEFINEPLRTYSTGMVMRLAFSVAMNTDPEILIVDEILAVGDQAFQAKCLDRIHDFRRQGKTMLCVSHSASMVEALCDRALWLNHGELVMTGAVREVDRAYAESARSGVQTA